VTLFLDSMAKTTPDVIAVLTGDVVDSSQLDRQERRTLPGVLRAAAKELQRAFGKAVPYDLEIFRGDSWQLVVTEPTLGIRAALFFRACVIAESPEGKRLDTRVAVAVDRIDFVPKRNISEGDGAAYRASGESLDQLGVGTRLTLAAPGDQAWRDVTVRLVDAVVQDWTARQARAVAGRLRGWTQVQIAERWPERITQQSVARHLARSHWAAVEAAVLQLENSLKGL
jgi:hypothetical protein